MPLTHINRKYLLEFIHQNKLHIKAKEGWENFSQNLRQPKALVLDIEDVESLQKLVKEIYSLNEEPEDPNDRILYRVAAGGRDIPYSESFSLTPGAEADIVFRLTGEEFHYLEETENEKVVRVGASMQIGELDEKLYHHYNLILPTSSLIKYPTVAGLAANAGHGTGVEQPGFAGLFTSMTFLLPSGEIVTIDESDPDFEILRGANLGLSGILLSAELKCVTAKKLRCQIEVRSLADFLDEVKQGLYFKDPYTSAMYVPTYYPDELTNRELKNVIVYRFNPVDREVDDHNNHPVLSHLAQKFEITLEEGFHVTDLLSLVPELIPDYMRYLVTRGAIGEKDHMIIGDWPNVYHYQVEYPHKINDVDVLFPVSMDSHEIVDAFVKMAQTNEEYAKKGQYPVTFAAYARFIQGTNGGLSTSAHASGQHVCGFDIVSSPGIPGLEAYRNEMFDFLISKLHGKPHWGKYAPEDLDYKKIYGEDMTKFVDTIKQWYAKHGMDLTRSPLLNTFLCHVLDLPEYAPNVESRQAIFNQSICTTKTACSMARVVLPMIEGDDEHAIRLRKRLHAIAESKLSSSSQTVLHVPSTEQKRTVRKHGEQPEPAKRDVRESSRCCILI